jgi:tetratricopeptide (TPR) repeat protein
MRARPCATNRPDVLRGHADDGILPRGDADGSMMTPNERTLPHALAADASRGLLAVALAGAALAVGAMHTVTLCLVTAVLAVATALAWWRAEPMRVRPAATLLLFVGIGLVSYTLLQCVPMPIRWLATIAPHNADVWSRALVPLHEPGPSWAPITLDPVGSRIELLKGVAYLLAFVTALRIAHRREGVTFLSGAIVITGVMLAVAALLHPAFGAHKLFGIYEPAPGAAEVHLAPLLNANNLAGYLNIAFCMTLAASLSREPRVPRAITIALTVLLGATQVWVASRGGVIAMLFGATTVAALALTERTKRRDPWMWLTLGCGAATLIGGVLIVLGSSQRAQSELLVTELSKFALLPDVLKMLPAYGVFGAGRGAFESVFPQFREGVGHITATYPENVVAQWIAEWGVPVGVAGLVAIVLALRPTTALARSRTAAGAWAALGTIAVQNMVDFSSEVPGVMLSVVVCAAIVVAGSAGLAPKWIGERWPGSTVLVARVGAAVSLLAIIGGVTALGRHVREDRRRLYDAGIVHGVPVEQMHDLARAAMLRHPAEPYLPFVTALRASRARDESPLPWLGATMERARVYGPAHFLAARVVGTRSPSQARLEYRLAMEQAPEIWAIVTPEASRFVGGYDDAMELVSEGAMGTWILPSLIVALEDRLPATCMRLDEELSTRAPHDVAPPKRAATNAVADLEAGDGAPWCQGAARAMCVDRALSLARSLEEKDPATCSGYSLEARALVASGRTAEAMDRLERIADKVSDRVTCLQVLADLARAVQDDRRFDAALGEIARAGCADEKRCVRNLVWVAQAQEARGSPGRALATYKRAHERAPDDDSLLESVARLAGASGLNAEALKDYQELARRHPGDERWKRAADEQREAIFRGVVKL